MKKETYIIIGILVVLIIIISIPIYKVLPTIQGYLQARRDGKNSNDRYLIYGELVPNEEEVCQLFEEKYGLVE